MSNSESCSSVSTGASIGVSSEADYDLVETEEIIQDDTYIFGHGIEDETGHRYDETDDETTGAYLDEPVADEEWLEQYRQKKEEDNKMATELQLRWEGTEPVTSWCSCGNCRKELLVNAKECMCCREIEKCKTFIDEVNIEFPDKNVTCVVNHPGFSAVCLNRWSLELASSKFKTRNGQRYRQCGLKERFLRGVSYRQFTRMVHGWLKDRRIPLPSCAYNLIRSTYKPKDEEFIGFEELETDEEV